MCLKSLGSLFASSQYEIAHFLGNSSQLVDV